MATFAPLHRVNFFTFFVPSWFCPQNLLSRIICFTWNCFGYLGCYPLHFRHALASFFLWSYTLKLILEIFKSIVILVIFYNFAQFDRTFLAINIFQKLGALFSSHRFKLRVSILIQKTIINVFFLEFPLLIPAIKNNRISNAGLQMIYELFTPYLTVLLIEWLIVMLLRLFDN